ncbi:MAG: ThiF family adenylyltransferase [candidate division Zixibacteria bacterium]|nr:ThiF family adenylyltransferase [candidate division Zixibacteria bacterium]MDH3938400.1 ThiF family adenylyltransferase [candidate division Zixibacteria bacterium]MDH4032335.1 ThiF family adenylyltransferase [candidate division Zixibacteria bacterium]
MFEIARTEIDVAAITRGFTSDSAGALASFEGRVRNRHQGRSVGSLEYHAYDALATKEGRRIVAEAIDKFDIIKIEAVHRVGSLQIGEVAIWIGVLAAHRAAAFEACRYVIDEIKRRVPIWKKEFYTDGSIDWVSCTHTGKPDLSESDYYSKQRLLPQVGTSGQERLKNARVAVVGAGGLGCPVLTNLAAAGVGRLAVFDHDKVETSNLHRQTLYTVDDVGRDKAVAAKERLEALNPFVKIEAHSLRVSTDESLHMLDGFDVVVDGTDNLETKYLLNRKCLDTQTPLVLAAVHHWQAVLHTFFTQDSGGCFNCLSDNTPNDDCVTGCTESGIMGVVPNLVGTLQAGEVISLLLGMKPTSADHGILIDLQSLAIQRYRRMQRVGCSVCCPDADTDSPRPAARASQFGEFEVDSRNVANHPSRFVTVDLRAEASGLVDSGIPNESQTVGQPSLEHLQTLPPGREYLLICEHGNTSKRLAHQLRGLGLGNFYSLHGGAESLSKHTNHC